MFGYILLDVRWAVVAVAVAAAVEAAALSFVGPASAPAARGSFLRRRLSTAIFFVAAVIGYHWMKDAYLADPFFHALYAYLLAFFLFYYMTGVTVALVTRSSGPGMEEAARTGAWVATVVLLAVFIAKPQPSTLGFFSGAAAHVAGGMIGRVPARGVGRRWLFIGLALLFAALLNWVSR
jgi:hypothetical protein